MTGRIAAIGALTAGLFTASVIGDKTPAAQADSGPSCYGDYCSGLYPNETGCDQDARTLTELVITDQGVHVGANISATPGITIDNGGSERQIAKLEVRWSDKCGTAWARLNTREDTDINVVGIEQNGGYEQMRDIGRFTEGSPSSISFTPMVYGRDNSYQTFITRSGSAIGNPFGDEITATYWTDEDLR